MCMNHTNKIECRQNKNNKTATTISPLEWAKENLEFELSFSTSLSLSIYLTRSVSVFGFSYDFLAVASTLALIQSPLIHIEPLTCTDTPLVVEYTHRTKSLLCVFHSFFCGPFVYAVFVFRRAWIDWNSYRYSQFQQNTCTELLFYQVTLHVQFHRIDS